MIRSIVLAGALAASAASGALAQSAPIPPHRPVHGGTIAADGRCKGVSYGTGARRCNTASGGPSGGLSSRN